MAEKGWEAARATLALWVAAIALAALLLYFFYRWETSVRDATVLGLLGISSLGHWIVDAPGPQ
ncbi:MAG: hypothetical protein K0U98_05385 [Deltaproteobacteria bacterium]|nr:hypothetical protein [Deltaproteobacteria bacterium]